jgi:AcrR family transcriptional regulator
VSNRHILDAAGQRNSAAVLYHFGTKADLVRAIVRSHSEPIEQRRQELIDSLGPTPGVRDWVSCLVRPSTEHLAHLGEPTWFARFRAQAVTDPVFREIGREGRERSPAVRRVVNGLASCVPDLPPAVYDERREMGVQLLIHGCAERESALAEGRLTPRANWADAATGIIDAVAALWLAPVTANPSGQ